MQKIYQTTFGHGKGNCLSACIATLTGIPIDAIPTFADKGAEWFPEMLRWLEWKGYGCVYYNFADPSNPVSEVIAVGFSILGMSTAGSDSEDHAVVARLLRVPGTKRYIGDTETGNREMLHASGETIRCVIETVREIWHDPNPHGSDLIAPQWELFLVPMSEVQ